MREIEARAVAAYRARFGGEPAVVTSAPGRVNLIGEHTDYNGGFALPCAVGFRFAMAASSADDADGALYSADFDDLRPLLPLAPHDADGDDGPREGSWADYPRGVAWALRESGRAVAPVRAAFAGDVPRGSGLSSSAAIEAAVVLGFVALAEAGDIPRRELAVLCQRAENGYIGVQTGIMDQYASLLCQDGHALLIDCRSLDAEAIPLDLDAAGLSLLIVDTRVARGLRDSAYNARRASCQRAAEALGVALLRDATPEQVAAASGRLSDEDFRRARHVVTENARVLDATDALRAGDFVRFGALMDASHDSLRDDYDVSSPELDAAVEAARASGALGARLTGAGFGGCAIALLRRDDVAACREAVAAAYAASGFAAPAFYETRPAAGAEVAGNTLNTEE